MMKREYGIAIYLKPSKTRLYWLTKEFYHLLYKLVKIHQDFYMYGEDDRKLS